MTEEAVMSRRAELRSHPRSEGTTGRLQALTDGFFAVSMTLGRLQHRLSTALRQPE
jgi:hypothetical protein